MMHMTKHMWVLLALIFLTAYVTVVGSMRYVVNENYVDAPLVEESLISKFVTEKLTDNNFITEPFEESLPSQEEKTPPESSNDFSTYEGYDGADYAGF